MAAQISSSIRYSELAMDKALQLCSELGYPHGDESACDSFARILYNDLNAFASQRPNAIDAGLLVAEYLSDTHAIFRNEWAPVGVK